MTSAPLWHTHIYNESLQTTDISITMRHHRPPHTTQDMLAHADTCSLTLSEHMALSSHTCVHIYSHVVIQACATLDTHIYSQKVGTISARNKWVQTPALPCSWQPIPQFSFCSLTPVLRVLLKVCPFSSTEQGLLAVTACTPLTSKASGRTTWACEV